MSKGLALLDDTVIAVFFAVMSGVGVYYSRKSKSSDQFFGSRPVTELASSHARAFM